MKQHVTIQLRTKPSSSNSVIASEAKQSPQAQQRRLLRPPDRVRSPRNDACSRVIEWLRQLSEVTLCFTVFAGTVLAVEPAWAMHVSEGILPLQWAALWALASLPFLAWGLRNLQERSRAEPHFKALVGLVGAGVFVISCMPIPVPNAGTCSHPCGTGIAAILIGPMLSAVVASVALTLQALFLAHGGLTSLGANIFAMGVVGSLAGYGAFRLAGSLGASRFVAAFSAGLVADWATYAATSFTLASALHGDGSLWNMFLGIMVAFVPTQAPLGILEGFISAGAYTFVQSRRPELLGMLVKGEAS